MQLQALEQTAAKVSGLLKSLSHPDRLMVLCHLAQGEMAAGELADALGRKAPAMSQQLAILRREGLIQARRDGQSIFYRIADGDALAILGFLYERFCNEDQQSAGPVDLSKAGAVA